MAARLIWTFSYEGKIWNLCHFLVTSWFMSVLLNHKRQFLNSLEQQKVSSSLWFYHNFCFFLWSLFYFSLSPQNFPKVKSDTKERKETFNADLLKNLNFTLSKSSCWWLNSFSWVWQFGFFVCFICVFFSKMLQFFLFGANAMRHFFFSLETILHFISHKGNCTVENDPYLDHRNWWEARIIN